MVGVSDYVRRTDPGYQERRLAYLKGVAAAAAAAAPLPAPRIDRFEVVGCEEGYCTYYVFFSPEPPAPDVNVLVLLNGRYVETGDVEGDRIDVTSRMGQPVRVELEFSRGAGSDREKMRGAGKMFTPMPPEPVIVAPVIPGMRSAAGCKLGRPVLDISLGECFAGVDWAPVPIPSCCRADRDESMLYSVWFNGRKQANTDDSHVDFDDLEPGRSYSVQVQAIPRADWGCVAGDKVRGSFRVPEPVSVSVPEPEPEPEVGPRVRFSRVAPSAPAPLSSYVRRTDPGYSASPSSRGVSSPSSSRGVRVPASSGVEVRETGDGAVVTVETGSGERVTVTVRAG